MLKISKTKGKMLIKLMKIKNLKSKSYKNKFKSLINRLMKWKDKLIKKMRSFVAKRQQFKNYQSNH